MFSLLSVNLIEVTKTVKLNWIGKVIRAIIEKPAYPVGLGIVLFTLILKLITMPFDVFSRVSSKNNSLKMEKMRPELEKLQKQYRNDKQLYQKKVMALQKKAGYSPLSSCLPSILSIVIFILVINQFNAYSRYSTNQLFRKMANSYNAKIETMVEDNELVEEDGKYYVNTEHENYTQWFSTNEQTSIFKEEDGEYVLKGENESEEAVTLYGLCKTYGLSDLYNPYFEFNEEKEVLGFKSTTTPEQIKAICSKVIELLNASYEKTYIISKAQSAAKKTFNKNRSSFLWVKNIWVADTSFRHPLESFSKVKDSVGSGFKANYYTLTGKMSTEKNQANGYYILVIISIGVMFLSQFIMGKEQKSQIELGSVEGKDSTMGQTQKYMKFLMPLMFGIFAFIYTSAFSVYMIVSSLFSTLSTLIITKIVTKVFEKKVLKEQNERDSRLKFKNKNK